MTAHRSAAQDAAVVRRTERALTQLEEVLTRSAALARDLLARTEPKEPDHG